MKILITGATGQIGSRLLVSMKERHDVIAAVRNEGPEGYECVNLELTGRESILSAIEKTKPDAVIHCAAVTSPDKCEKEKELCRQVNVEGTETLARACADNKIKMVYLSTDLVFDGEKGDYTETDAPNPLNFYAESKLEGEAKVSAVLPDAIIARTTIVFGRGAFSRIGNPFWIVKSLRSGEEIFLFTDQLRSHFYLGDCAQAITLLLERGCGGLYHLSPGRKESRYDFGIALADAMGLDKSLIVPATMSEKPSDAKRPRDCSLSNEKLVRDTGFQPIPLDEMLKLLSEEFPPV